MLRRHFCLLVSPALDQQSVDFRTAVASIKQNRRIRILDFDPNLQSFGKQVLSKPDLIWIDTKASATELTDIAKWVESAKPTNIIGQPSPVFVDARPLHEQVANGAEAKNCEEPGAEEALRKDGKDSVEVMIVSELEKVFRSQSALERPKEQSYSWLGRTTFADDADQKAIFEEQRFRHLVHNSIDLTCVIERDGFIKYASARSKEILGLEPSSLAGQNVQSVLVGLKLSDLKLLVCDGTPGSILDITARHADGHLVYLEVSFSDFTKDSAILGYLIMARDVSYKKQAQQKLQYKALLLSNIREAVVGLDPERRVIYLNAAAERIFKVQHADVFLKPVDSLFIFGWNHDDEEAYMREALAESGLWLGDIAINTQKGRKVFGEVSITSHKEQQNVAPGTLIVIRDVRDRKVVETVLHESENRFKSLVNITSDLVWQLTDENCISYISPKVSHLLGYQSNEICGRFLYDLLPATVVGSAQALKLRDTLLSKESFTFEQYNFAAQAGDERVFELSGVPLYGGNGAFFGYQGVIRDITERIEDERKLKQSLREKEVLIKEIHHRVKNNMQIVSSLLFLQTQFIHDPEMLERLQDSQDRIRSMALVHEKLYQSKDLSSIDFKDYLESLTQHIANTYRNPLIRVEIDTDPEGVQLGIDTAVPLGLIVNELVSNTFKHAFAAGQRGLVSIHLTVKPSGNTLEVTDDGKGIEHTEIAHYEETSLGMQLVGALTQQLQGSLAICNENGSTFTLRF